EEDEPGEEGQDPGFPGRTEIRRTQVPGIVRIRDPGPGRDRSTETHGELESQHPLQIGVHETHDPGDLHPSLNTLSIAALDLRVVSSIDHETDDEGSVLEIRFPHEEDFPGHREF